MQPSNNLPFPTNTMRLINGNIRHWHPEGYYDINENGHVAHVFNSDADGLPHSKNDLPSIASTAPWSSEKMYHKHGILHRINGPAIERRWVENGRWLVQRDYYVEGVYRRSEVVARSES